MLLFIANAELKKKKKILSLNLSSNAVDVLRKKCCELKRRDKMKKEEKRERKKKMNRNESS